MPNHNLASASDVATAVRDDLHHTGEELNDFTLIGAGETNHNVNERCCNYFEDVGKILDSYSQSAVRDAEKIATIDNQLAILDSTLKLEMQLEI